MTAMAFLSAQACHNNLVYNNYVNNSRNANINTRDTTWNVAKISGRNIVGGPYIGGNFWAKPEGTGFSQKQPMKTKTGLPIPHILTSQATLQITCLLHLYISASQSCLLQTSAPMLLSGYAPLSVQFTDLSQNAITWRWDFENDGNIDSLEKNPVHTYDNSRKLYR